jgi:hypothetical protein
MAFKVGSAPLKSERFPNARLRVFRSPGKPKVEEFTGWCIIQIFPGSAEVRHYVNGVLKNEHGPAIINVNTLQQVWMTNDCAMFHRLDGPAIINFKNLTVEWFINGVEYNKEQFWSHPLVVQNKLNKLLETDPP